MSWQQPELFSSNHSNTSSNYSFIDSVQKPVEIYVFIDPLSEECWSLQTYLKKLTMEYGRFFTIRPIVSGYLSLINNSNCELTRDISTNAEGSYIGETKLNYYVDQPWITSLAIKAAELQGKRAGKKFLRKLQEKLFLEKLNVSVQDVLLECAKDANLDLQEFERDLFSSSAENAYKCDRRLTREMDVDHLPTMVFFNQVVEEHGIKVSGLYPYEIYELVLSEILQHNPIPSTKPSLEEFVTRYSLVGIKEISIVYDWTLQKAEKEMKKLQFKQKVERVSGDYGGFWRAVK